MPKLNSLDASVPGFGLDILSKFDSPLLTNVRFDGWRDQEFAEEWVDSLTEPIIKNLRLLSRLSRNVTHLELRSTVMHILGDDYRWLMSKNAFPRLEVMRLYAADITDSTLRLGAGRRMSLKRLELLACVGVSGNGILDFVKGRNQDFELLIDACPGVKPEERTKLSEIVKIL